MISLILSLSLLSQPDRVTQCQVGSDAQLLNIEHFDQSQDGWRKLEKSPGCERAVAEAIRMYREKVEEFAPLLYWHEGQYRAILGEYKEAKRLFAASRYKDPAADKTGWNLYVDASIAFLDNDKRRLQQALRSLRKLKRPADWPAAIPWPQNEQVIVSLLACLGRPYASAYPTCLP